MDETEQSDGDSVCIKVFYDDKEFITYKIRNDVLVYEFLAEVTTDPRFFALSIDEYTDLDPNTSFGQLIEKKIICNNCELHVFYKEPDFDRLIIKIFNQIYYFIIDIVSRLRRSIYGLDRGGLKQD